MECTSSDKTGGYKFDFNSACTKRGLPVVLDDQHTYPFEQQSSLLFSTRHIKAGAEVIGAQKKNGLEDENDSWWHDDYEEIEERARCKHPIEVFEYELLSCDKSRNEHVYHIWVDFMKFKRCVESQCLDMLKQAGCEESCFLRCSRKDRFCFYAKLDDQQCARLKCVSGIFDIVKYGELLYAV